MAISEEGTPTAADIGWQEAVARLAHERTLAVTCAALLKKHGDASAIDRGALAYAKAEYDAIVAGLVVALARRDKPSSLPDMEARLRHGFGKRMVFCENVQQLLPPTTGQKSLIADIVKGAVGPVVDA